jgi:hypothetical protein
MADDILSEYGGDSGAPQKPRASNGGRQDVKSIPYSEPVGPRNKTEVGRSGTNHGCCGTQGKH